MINVQQMTTARMRTESNERAEMLGSGMKAARLGIVIATACLTTLSMATPLAAGALSDLVGFGSQNVYLKSLADKGSGAPPPHQADKTKHVPLSKDCIGAGSKTSKDCEAFHVAHANKPADTVIKQSGRPAAGPAPAAAASANPPQAGSASPAPVPAIPANGNPPTVVVSTPTALVQTQTGSPAVPSAVTLQGSGSPPSCNGAPSGLEVLTAIHNC
jgi:hypothetical protein